MQTIIHNHRQFIPLTLEPIQAASNILRIEALIDTGCNADLCISRELADKLQAKVTKLKNSQVQYAKGISEEAQICTLKASFLSIDLEYTDFEVIAFVTDKEKWQDVEIGNKVLSKFCVNNKLVLEFDYYQNLVKFKNRRKSKQ